MMVIYINEQLGDFIDFISPHAGFRFSKFLAEMFIDSFLCSIMNLIYNHIARTFFITPFLTQIFFSVIDSGVSKTQFYILLQRKPVALL